MANYQRLDRVVAHEDRRAVRADGLGRAERRERVQHFVRAEMDEVRQRNGCVSTFEWRLDGAGSALGLDDVAHLPPDLCSAHVGGESLKS